MPTPDPRRESAEGGAALASAPRSPSTRRPAQSALLCGSPHAILARITAGDPLRLLPVVARRLEERRCLMDSARVHRLALVLCARRARRYRGRPALGRWLEAQVDSAIDALCEEGGGDPEDGGPWAPLARPLGLGARAMRRACGDFNRLPFPEREAFFQLVLEEVSLDELAGRSRGSATELARRARRALQVFLERIGEETST